MQRVYSSFHFVNFENLKKYMNLIEVDIENALNFYFPNIAVKARISTKKYDVFFNISQDGNDIVHISFHKNATNNRHDLKGTIHFRWADEIKTPFSEIMFNEDTRNFYRGATQTNCPDVLNTYHRIWYYDNQLIIEDDNSYWIRAFVEKILLNVLNDFSNSILRTGKQMYRGDRNSGSGRGNDIWYKNKYLKYKNKYLKLKKSFQLD